jgi:transposase-like protein
MAVMVPVAVNKKIKWRIHVAGAFPNHEDVIRLAGALMLE